MSLPHKWRTLSAWTLRLDFEEISSTSWAVLVSSQTGVGSENYNRILITVHSFIVDVNSCIFTNRIVKRLSGQFIPGNYSFPLIGNSNCFNVTWIYTQFLHVFNGLIHTT